MGGFVVGETIAVSLENMSSEGERPPFPVETGGAEQGAGNRARMCTEFLSSPTQLTCGRGVNRETDTWIA